MPEAIKEVAPEKTPEKIVAKEIKPAEASSGTLPADEQRLKDGEEGAVAPEVAAVENPEEGKSIPEPSAQQAALVSDGNGVTDDSPNSTPEEDDKSKPDKIEEPEKASNGSCSESVQSSTEQETSKEGTDKNADTCAKAEETKADSKPSEVIEAEPKKEKDQSENKGVEDSEATAPILKESNAVEDKKGESKCLESSKNKEDENKSIESSKIKDDKKKLHESNDKVDENKPLESSENKEVENRSIESDDNKKKNEAPQASENKTNETDVGMEVDNKERLSEKESHMDTEKVSNKSEDKIPEVKETPAGLKIKSVVTFSTDSNDQPTSELKSENGDKGKKQPEPHKAGEEASMQKDTNEPSEPNSECAPVLVNGKSNGNEAGRSGEVDPAQAEEIKKLISDAKQHMIGGEHFNAADLLGKACEIAGKLYGDLASENGELYYLYGCAMLECAKNENTVLGEAVKEEEGSEETEEDKDEESNEVDNKNESEDNENKQNGDEATMNGDEAMEVVENEAETEEGTNENGIDSETTAADPEKENEEEDDSSLKTAWEMFELAKVIFGKTENSSRLADTYIKLGEVGMESGHGDSVDDMKKALELRLGFASENHRLLAETHFNIGLAYATFQNFDSAIESFQQSKSMLEAKINKLKLAEQTKDSEDEIKELSGLLPDLDEKIQDMRDSKAAKIKGDEVLKEGCSTSSEGSNKPVSNISHLVKRKRKLEDVTSELLPNTKQPCTEENKPEVKENASKEDIPKEQSASTETPKVLEPAKEESVTKEEKGLDEKSTAMETCTPMEECPPSTEEKSATPAKETTPAEESTPKEAVAV